MSQFLRTNKPSVARCSVLILLFWYTGTSALAFAPLKTTQSVPCHGLTSHKTFYPISSWQHRQSHSLAPFFAASTDGSESEKALALESGGDGGDNNKNGGHSNKDEKNDGPFGWIKNWYESDEGKADVKTYFVSLFIALLVRFTIIEPRFIPSLSMYPTFEVGDQLAVEKVTKRIKPFYRNEVVVFRPPQAFNDFLVQEMGMENGNGAINREALIKRIVALPGDTVQVKGGKLFINGEPQNEPFTAEEAAYQFGPVQVPEEMVLVLGDNRNHSLDGHIWGFLPQKNVIGRAVFVYWPPWRVGNAGMY